MAKGFEVPNHTQTPNSFFAAMPKIRSAAELKIVLAVIRRTFGWHKESDKISLTQLQEDTGLTRESVSQGIQNALSHKYITRTKDGQGHIYSLRLVKKSDWSEKPTSRKNRPKVVKKSDHQLVGNIDPQKKGIKEKKEKIGASAEIPHSGIALLREVQGIYPPKESNQRYLEILDVCPNERLLRACRAEWLDRGYNKMSWKWFTDWYVQGFVPERNGQPKPKINNSGETIVADHGDWYEVEACQGGGTSPRYRTAEAFARQTGRDLAKVLEAGWN